MANRRRQGYSISVVAQLYRVHPQTLRLYEREGLLKPNRSRGNTRQYLDEDLRRLELILSLTRELKVNLAGVEVILGMREKLETLQQERAEILQFLRARLEHDGITRERLRTALVRRPPTKILKVQNYR